MKRIFYKRILWICLMIFITAKSSGQTSDSLRLEKSTEHFNLFSTTKDSIVLDTLALVLENNYAKITGHLGITLDKKTTVKVFPDLTSFHKAINTPEAPDWVVGSCMNNELLMVSPLNPGSVHTFSSLLQVIVHEFAHLAVFYALDEKGISTLPQWLSEGFAQYEAGQINDHIKRIVVSGFKKTAPPTWEQLSSASMLEFGQMNGYAISVTIVEFLVNTYGMEKLVALLKAPEHIETIYGLSQENLEKQWIQYLGMN